MSWHDTHQWRAGTDDIVRRCTQTAEQYLLPFYLGRLTVAADSIHELLALVLDALQMPEEDLQKHAGTVDRRPLDLSLYELTDPRHAWQSLPVPDKYFALVCAKRSLFLATREMILDMLRRLEQTRRG
jgi:hypothetical protein